jgi:hypothetical protein
MIILLTNVTISLEFCICIPDQEITCFYRSRGYILQFRCNPAMYSEVNRCEISVSHRGLIKVSTSYLTPHYIFFSFLPFLSSCFSLCIPFSKTISLFYLREKFASIQNKCRINSNEQSHLTEVNTASAIRETPRIFWNPKVYRRVRSIPPLCLSSFSP